MKKKLVILLTALVLFICSAVPAQADDLWFGRFGEAPSDDTGRTIAQLADSIYENYSVEAFYLYTDSQYDRAGGEAYAASVIEDYTDTQDTVVYLRNTESSMVVTAGNCENIFTDNEIQTLCTACAQYEDAGMYDMAAIVYFNNVFQILNTAYGAGTQVPEEETGVTLGEDADAALGEEEATDTVEESVPSVISSQEEAPDLAVTADAQTTGEAPAKSGSVVKGILISLVIGLIVAAIVIGSIKSKYKPVRKNTAAADYLVSGSVQVTGAYENFVRTQTDRREINTQSNQNNQNR